MASCKSYRNRLNEIRNLSYLVQQYEMCLKNKDIEISQLQQRIQYLLNTVADSFAASLQPPVIMNLGKQEIELLKQEIEALKLTLRLYREYILKTYHDADFIDIVDIPNCLKPLDSIKYVGERNGFDHLSS